MLLCSLRPLRKYAFAQKQGNNVLRCASRHSICRAPASVAENALQFSCSWERRLPTRHPRSARSLQFRSNTRSRSCPRDEAVVPQHRNLTV
ncbi:hypothetical protein OSTOST_24796 [Ostertagia ostertagi]